MKRKAETFPYLPRFPQDRETSLLPLAPLELFNDERAVNVLALLDTGAMVNVLPYEIGQRLGLDWDRHRVEIPLSGNLAASETRAVKLFAKVGQLPGVDLGFAWAKSHSGPIILGQINFFLKFEVCFFRPREEFEIRPRRSRRT